MAIQRVPGNCAKMIPAMTMIGTQRTAPMIPQIAVEMARPMTITRGLRLRDEPMKCGSIQLWSKSCTGVRHAITIRNGVRVSNCSRASTDGKMMLNSVPIVGMKPSRKTTNAHRMAKSTPTATRTAKVATAASRPMTNLIQIYSWIWD